MKAINDLFSVDIAFRLRKRCTRSSACLVIYEQSLPYMRGNVSIQKQTYLIILIFKSERLRD